jgi:hypothetical protein
VGREVLDESGTRLRLVVTPTTLMGVVISLNRHRGTFPLSLLESLRVTLLRFC